MRRIARRHCRPGARIEQIVADLRSIERTRIDDLVQRRGVADRGDAVEADLALLAQAPEGRPDFAGYDLGRHVAVAAVPGDMVVKLEQIDLVELEALQARL